MTIMLLLGALSAAGQTNTQWNCHSPAPIEEFGFQCPTIECVLQSGAYIDVAERDSVKTVFEKLCIGSQEARISKTIGVGFIDIVGENWFDLFVDPCSWDTTDKTVTGFRFAETLPDTNPIVRHALIDVESSQVSRIAWEAREAQCYWEKGF